MSTTTSHTSPLARVLIIGASSAQLAQSLRLHSGTLLAIESTRLPAQGIRLFEQTPPDALILTAKDQGNATRALIQAIVSRPLGQLIPIVAMTPRPDSLASPEELASELHVNVWCPLDTSPYHVLSTLADILDMTELVSQPPLPDEPTSPPPALRTKEGLLAQETAPTREVMVSLDPGIFPKGSPSAVAKVDRESIFPVRAQPTKEGELSEEMVRRKLKEVRHEDYYTILEVRRGAETPVVKDAYMRIMARFDGARLDFELVHNCYQELAEIADAIEDAWAVLGDGELRRRYLSSLTTKH